MKLDEQSEWAVGLCKFVAGGLLKSVKFTANDHGLLSAEVEYMPQLEGLVFPEGFPLDSILPEGRAR
jgi:hypothetical protein